MADARKLASDDLVLDCMRIGSIRFCPKQLGDFEDSEFVV